MSVSERPSLRRRSCGRKSCGCLLILLLIPLVYYFLQVALRTPPLTPLQVIAHRGGPAYAPENTRLAFNTAIAQGVDWLEFDVQMTRDGELVVIHDETVDRTTDGVGPVAGLTLEQIRSLDAGQGEKVPTFKEVVELAKAAGVKIFPETKSAHLYPGVEEKMLQVLDETGYRDRAAVQSFEPPSLETLKRLDPSLRRCALSGLWKLSLSSPPGDPQIVCPMAEMVLLNPLMVRQAHAAGRPVFVYFGLFENPFMFKVMRFFGVDGLMSDDPLALKAALR
jgi:glycerophosphoryl diester phosphodiesterase